MDLRLMLDGSIRVKLSHGDNNDKQLGSEIDTSLFSQSICKYDSRLEM